MGDQFNGTATALVMHSRIQKVPCASSSQVSNQKENICLCVKRCLFACQQIAWNAARIGRNRHCDQLRSGTLPQRHQLKVWNRTVPNNIQINLTIISRLIMYCRLSHNNIGDEGLEVFSLEGLMQCKNLTSLW